MIKIVASHSMKVPANQDFSSKSFHVGLEVEVADTLDGEGILAKTAELFHLAKTSVENQLNGRNPSTRPSTPADEGSSSSPQPNGGNGGTPASSKQLNYLVSLARKNGGLKKLEETIQSRFGLPNVGSLSKSACSRLIEEMKKGDIHHVGS